MKPGIYRAVLFFIALTIVATIGLQLRWNVRNYHENRRQLISEIQSIFDTSVENYYTEKTNKEAAVFSQTLRAKFPERFSDSSNIELSPTDARTVVFTSHSKTANRKNLRMVRASSPFLRDSLGLHRGEFDRNRSEKIMVFARRIFASFEKSDSIDMEKFNRTLSHEFERRKIKIDYNIERIEDDISRHRENPALINVLANTTYLPPMQNLRLSYPDPTLMVFKRSLNEILLSLLLSLSVIGCLLYLLYIINRQKKIDEIRNDLISNITHEFKTPITTIGSAIEGIRNFTAENDTAKANRYLDISERQLGKLQTMVEKLLDTATLDTGALVLNKEPLDLVEMLNSIAEKFQINADSQISFKYRHNDFIIHADAFHLEAAISNLVDNAVKYGGNEINLRLEKPRGQTEIYIEDNGVGIDKRHREQIFEKFYRIPTGNVHDVKGFGIGLFYSRKIIEKHGGSLELIANAEKTIFKIALPYA